MVGTNARLVCPGSEGSEPRAEHEARERKDGGDERAGPASTKVRELRDGLGKQDLVGVALEIAQDVRAEDCCHNDDAEESGRDVVVSVGEGGVQQDFAIAVANRSEVLRRNAQEGKRDPQQEVDVSGEALEAELEFESE